MTTPAQQVLDALNQMASWDEGQEVDAGFDEPCSATIARRVIPAAQKLVEMGSERPSGEFWRVWWQGSGPERGDHIMAVTDSGVEYKHEVAYIGDQHHSAAGKIVAAHNASVAIKTAFYEALLRISSARDSGSSDARYLAGIALAALAEKDAE